MYEGGGIARNSGASVALIEGDRGRFRLEDVCELIRPDDLHRPVTKLVAVENTVNKGGGAIWDYSELKRISDFCASHCIAFHLDGARLFNALVETGKALSVWRDL
jgi:threonine aldolase